MVANAEENLMAFVLMPFKTEEEELYSEIIAPALEEVVYEVKKADSTLDQQNILKDIIPNIAKADLIIAEISNLNANVLYELGISHGLLKPTVLLAQNIEEVPFDLRSYRIIIYSTKFNEINKLKYDLRSIAEKHRHGDIVFGNPVSDFAPEMIILKKSVVIQSKNTIASNGVDKQVLEPEESEEPGRFDILYDSLKSLQEICGRTEIFTSLIKDFGEKVRKNVSRLASIGKVDSLKSVSQVKQISKNMSSIMVQFSNDIEKQLPEYSDFWKKFVDNSISLFSQAVIKSEEDKKVALVLIGKTSDFKENSRGAIESVKILKESVIKSKGFSRDLDRGIKRVDKALSSLVEALVIGESYLSRIINILEERLDAE